VDFFTQMLVLGGSQLLGGLLEADAAEEAAGIQAGASQAGIAEQRRQFDELQRMLAPYRQAGEVALGRLAPYITGGERAYEQQAALAGLSGPEAQRAAVEAISGSPGFQESVRQGEEALLSRASATGGLRGGNIQAALGQFRPQMLEQAINQAYGRFGGLAGTGLNLTGGLVSGGRGAAGMTGEAGQAMAGNIGNLLAQQGAAQAGGALAGAAPFAQLAALPGQLVGLNLGMGGSLFGGGGRSIPAFRDTNTGLGSRAGMVDAPF
jgi:hypothetical protein